MKREIKFAVITTAAALMAIGAGFTSMAAQKGTWKLVDGEWYCFDSDGDAIEDTFCLSNGKEFYVGEDGKLVRSSWVDVDGDWYYVNSGGEKVTNEWRYTAPAEDEDEDEEWYYLQASGKRTEGKKQVIGGETYFFDEDGKMLTGWIQESGDGWEEAEDVNVSETDTYYCGEDGARLKGAWVKTYGPGVDEDEADDEDEKWFYIKSNGKPATGKQSSINGETYFFNNYGEMLTGWVAGSGSNYAEIWDEDGSGVALSTAAAEGNDVYFCGGENDGHAKKNKWYKGLSSTDYENEDSDDDKFWYYIQKNGKVYIPVDGSEGNLVSAQTYLLDDGLADLDKRFEADENYEVMTKKVNGDTYLFNSDGQMVSGFVKMDGNMYYFGGENDGARKTGSFSVKDENGETVKCYFSADSNTDEGYVAGAGVNGAKSGKLYADGILVTAEEDKYEIKEVNGMKFVVNKAGTIQTSSGPYKDGGDELFGGATFTYNPDKGVSYKSIKTMTE